MKYETKKPWLNRLRMVLGAAALSVLAACGGGEGASGPNIPNINTTSVTQETIASIPIIAARDAVVSISNTNTISIQGNSFDVNSYKEGQIVSIPADENKFPLGFTGRVVSNTRNGENNTVELIPATVPEVFNKLNIDFDSIRDNGRIVGIISPANKNGKVVFNKSSNINQNGLNLLKSTNTGFEGVLGLQIPIKDNISLQFKGEIKNLIVKKRLVYEGPIITGNDPIYGPGATLPTPSSYKEVSSRVTGDISGSIKFAYEKSTPCTNSACQLNDLSAFAFNGVQGLDGTDKIGLYPLAGLIIQPGNISPTVNSDALLYTPGIIVWLYVNLNGEIKVSGDFTALEFKTNFNHEFSLLPNANNELESNIPSPPQPENTLKTSINGSVNINQKIGFTVAADLFVGGIRPLTVQVSPLIGEVNASITGSGAYDWIGKQWSGSICTEKFSSSIKTQIFAKAALGVKIKDWINIGGSWQKTMDFPYDQIGFNSPLCLASGSLDMKITPDTVNGKKYLVDISSSFKDLELPTDAKFLGEKEPSVDWVVEVFRQGEASPIFSDQGKYLTVSSHFTDMRGYSKNPQFTVIFPESGIYKVKLSTSARAFNFDSKFVEKTITVTPAPLTCTPPQVLQGNTCVTTVSSCADGQTLGNDGMCRPQGGIVTVVGGYNFNVQENKMYLGLYPYNNTIVTVRGRSLPQTAVVDVAGLECNIEAPTTAGSFGQIGSFSITKNTASGKVTYPDSNGYANGFASVCRGVQMEHGKRYIATIKTAPESMNGKILGSFELVVN